MDEVAQAAAPAVPLRELPTARLAKVGDGRELRVDGPSIIPPAIQVLHRLLRVLLVLEARIDIAHEMIVIVIAHDDLLQLAKAARLAVEVLEEGVEFVLQLHGRVLVAWLEGGVGVDVGAEDGLRVAGPDVLPAAPVAVSAGPDLVVEGAVDLVLLRPKNGGESVCHGWERNRKRENDRNEDRRIKNSEKKRCRGAQCCWLPGACP